MEQRLLTENQVVAYLGVSRPTARKRMDEIGATLHMGRRVLYDKVVIDKHIDDLVEMENTNGRKQSI